MHVIAITCHVAIDCDTQSQLSSTAMAKGMIADSVVASRKLSLAFVALLSLCTSVQAKTNNYTLWVIRGSFNDLYRLNSIDRHEVDRHEVCDPSASYLIDEKQCAMDEELFNGMYHVGGMYTLTIIVSEHA